MMPVLLAGCQTSDEVNMSTLSLESGISHVDTSTLAVMSPQNSGDDAEPAATYSIDHTLYLQEAADVLTPMPIVEDRDEITTAQIEATGAYQ